MSEKFYPQGTLCISSVTSNKEAGFSDYRYVACIAAQEFGFRVIRNPEDDGMTQEDFEYAMENENPVFILIVGEVSSDMVNAEFATAKSNCLPMFVFIKSVNRKISESTKKNMKELSEVTYDKCCSFFDTCEQLHSQVRERLRKYIQKKLETYPILQKGTDLAYIANKQLMKVARRQIIIYQNTSILLLGARSSVYENAFMAELMKWLRGMRDDIEFLHVFCMNETLEEIRNNAGSYNLQAAKENILELYRMYEEQGKANILNIRYSEKPNNVSYVITDTNLVFVIPVEDERYTIELPSYIMQVNQIEKIKDELYHKTKKLDRETLMKIYEGV